MASRLLGFLFPFFFHLLTSVTSSINGLTAFLFLRLILSQVFFLHFSWICCFLFPQQTVWPPPFLNLQQHFSNKAELLFLLSDLGFIQTDLQLSVKIVVLVLLFLCSRAVTGPHFLKNKVLHLLALSTIYVNLHS